MLKTKRQEKEISKLRNALIDEASRDIYLKKFIAENGEANFTIGGSAIHLLSAIIIKEFYASGAINFLDVDMFDDKGERYSLSIQKIIGMTPSEKVKKAHMLSQILISEESSMDEKIEASNELNSLFPSK